MKTILLLALSIMIIFSCKCKPTEKVNQEKSDDGDVLRPKEGYGNPRFARSVNYVDSLNRLKLSARPVPCSQVQGLTTTAISNTSVSIFWTSTGAKRYAVYLNATINAKGGTKVGDPSTNSFTITGLTAGKTYWVSVAMYGQGNKVCDISETIEVQTTSTPPPPPPPPPPPSGGQANVVCLVFDSITVSNTSWSSTPIFSPGSGFTPDEQLAVFNMVKDAYRYHPKIIFTMDRAVFNAADPAYRQMTIFTTNSSWYGQAGGVSYINSWNTNTPNWVFSALLNYSVRNNGLAAPHEIGHALGLYHNVDSCTQSYGLSRVCSDGISRAPWMGGSYTDFQHYFYPEYNATWTTTGIARNTCQKPDENATIASKLK